MDNKFRAVNLLPHPDAFHIIVGKFTDDHPIATEDNQNGVVAYCDGKYWADKIVNALNIMEGK